ncbi:Tc5 transposase DNA-binding domain [Popillia japonica]|uniref:Tc5 transposase DNA-binding domain n=1 Tax=Popillia japonica TaxID=7064 RepID=A0AAW1IWP1_POPJA
MMGSSDKDELLAHLVVAEEQTRDTAAGAVEVAADGGASAADGDDASAADGGGSSAVLLQQMATVVLRQRARRPGRHVTAVRTATVVVFYGGTCPTSDGRTRRYATLRRTAIFIAPFTYFTTTGRRTYSYFYSPVYVFYDNWTKDVCRWWNTIVYCRRRGRRRRTYVETILSAAGSRRSPNPLRHVYYPGVGRYFSHVYYPGVGRYFMRHFDADVHHAIVLEEFDVGQYNVAMLKRLCEGRNYSYPVSRTRDRTMTFRGPIIFVSPDDTYIRSAAGEPFLRRLFAVHAAVPYWHAEKIIVPDSSAAGEPFLRRLFAVHAAVPYWHAEKIIVPDSCYDDDDVEAQVSTSSSSDATMVLLSSASAPPAAVEHDHDNNISESSSDSSRTKMNRLHFYACLRLKGYITLYQTAIGVWLDSVFTFQRSAVWRALPGRVRLLLTEQSVFHKSVCLFLSQKEDSAKKGLGRHKPVFSPAQEKELVEYILCMESRLFGLTLDALRSLAFELAQRNGMPNRFNKTKKKAGKAWLYAFLNRHPNLKLRSPEPTSLARAMGFNRPSVEKFFSLIKPF